MKEADKKALIAIPLVILIGVGVALAGSQGSMQVFGLPLFALAVGYAFVLNWLVYIFAYIYQTEHFFDLTGSLTYITTTILVMLLSPVRDARSWLLMAMVLLWAGRLGSFLFLRVRKAGKDDRFDEIKPSFVRFLNVWTLQGLWVTFTLSAALVTMTTATRKPLGIFAIVGFLVWVLGFVFEVVADAQKSRFKADPANKGKFIHTGLWSRSRHPNYFGEITLWLGVAIIALPVLSGWQWVAMISPIFVFLLLTRVSGVPMLEKKADDKWGGQEDYEEYKKNTPVLFPKL
ncbi:MAG: DUF1295 domain-containing protein [Anaerolineaceae bacterium]|jgi:steroid 5-alpha reductase family enzyme|nr:DUF1295 domain-containing protein [Anaerolineaceae bacterium]